MSKKKGTSPSTNSLPQSRSPSPAFPSTRYLFFGGKGGVGKTTAAAATALFLLEQSRTPERILLFSTDPAHSLSDSLDLKIGDRLVEIARREGSVVIAREMNPARALAKFKEKHRATIAEIADRGTFLDKADINELMNLSLPGMDEVMALFELSECDWSDSFTRVVVDTAPSGHTSRLLRLPDVFEHWIGALDQMAQKHRFMVSHFARGRRPAEDGVDLFLRGLGERLERVRTMLFHRDRTAFTLITIPDAMSVMETSRYFGFLRDQGVPVTDLIINRVESEQRECAYCRARASGQKRWLEKAERVFADLRIHRVALFDEEVRGRQGLLRFASSAWESRAETTAGSRARRLPRVSAPPREPRTQFQLHPKRLLIFGGKGGVGKTTMAAEAALALAKSCADARVLIFSTDPAHSLSDSFDEKIGELKRGVAGLPNLDGMEIDPVARFEEFKERYRNTMDEAIKSLTAGSRWEIQFESESLGELMALAPPGIDEMAALSAISDLLAKGLYTSIVIDTAPTGHLVRFLELPEVALSWVRTLMRLMLKYKDVVRVGSFAQELVDMSKNIKRISSMLSNPKECEFVGVAIPERMSLEETDRLAQSLTQLSVAMRRLLINNVISDEVARACDFCAARRRRQQRNIKAFQRTFAAKALLFSAPQEPYEIRGPGRLLEHFSKWEQLAATEARH